MKYFKFAKLKYYFEKGYSLLSYPKWVVAEFGVGEVINKNYGAVIIGAFVFSIFCVLIGKWFYNSGFASAELEVSNLINPFVDEVRNSKIFKHQKSK